MSPSSKTPPRSVQQNLDIPPTVTKIKSHSAQQYMSSIPSMDQLRPKVGNEVRGFFAKSRPLRLQYFMHKYLPSVPADSVPIERVFPPDLFADVAAATSENGMYTPLRDALTTLLQTVGGAEETTLDFTVTSNLRQKLAPELYSMNPDLCAFHRDHSNEEISWEYVDLPIEVKLSRSADPVSATPSSAPEPTAGVVEVVDSLTRDESMAQIDDYSRYTTYIQARSRVFILGIFGRFARIFVFDRVAVAFSEHFNYIDHPELLGEFLRRYSKSSRAARGWDPTVTYDLADIELQKIERAIETWNCLRAKVRNEHKVDIGPVERTSCRITVSKDGKDHFFLTVGGPIFASMGLFSRGTRIWFAFHSSEELAEDASNAVVIKDFWTHEGRTLEESFYDVLGEYGPDEGIAQYGFSASFNDDGFHTTANHDIAGVCLRRHCRAVINTLGRRLSRYKSTKELVQGIDSAIAGHQKAFEKGVLHRDISERNVMLPLIPETPTNAGFIIDFDLSLFISGSERVHEENWDLTGTIQFMAVARLQKSDIRHEMWHDLESFFWVLLYVVARHTQNSWVTSSDKKARLLLLFETPNLPSLADLRGRFLERCRQDFFVEGNAPLTHCIHELADLFANAYPLPSLKLKPVIPTYDDFRKILSTSLSADGWLDDDSPQKWEPPNMQGGIIQPISRQKMLRQLGGSGSLRSGLGKRKSDSRGDSAVRSKKKSKGGAA